MIRDEKELRCSPLRSVREIQDFLNNPPAWRSLCAGLRPHSRYKVKNMEVARGGGSATLVLEKTATFCHYDPDNDPEAASAARHDEAALPRTLVCHDMANGYHDDSFVDGTGNHTAYTFYNWAGIDIFCYFSHHLVTVPPLGWINVAHAHGVKVIGTVITEWAEGTLFWDQVLSSDVNQNNFMSVLVAIAKTLKFDGWLLNIENKVSEPGKLVSFVRGLHAMLHSELPHATLIWYDSVTANGQLNWQNQLNDKNRAFFDACDGFFTNYSWLESDLDESVAAAGDRRHDLFIGMDVWGRNFHGGGMFNLQEAMKLAHSRGCSVAIFAPAWTREALGDDDPDDYNHIEMGQHLTTLEQFLLRDRALWDSIWPFLNTRLPSELPFQTSFCLGLGKKRRLYGEVLCPVPWYNLRHQQYQPNSWHGPHGYVLSTQSKLTRASKQALPGGGTGIVKYREVLYKVAEVPTTAEDDEEDVAPVAALKDDSLTLLPSEEEKHVLKKTKPEDGGETETKSETEPEPEAEPEPEPDVEPEPETEAEPEAELEAGTSEQQRSVQLHEPSIRIRLSEPQSKRRLKLALVADELPCVEAHFEDSFNGGSCLRLNPSDRVARLHRFARLFHCDFACAGRLVVCVATKALPEAPTQYLTVHMYYSSPRGSSASAGSSAESLAVLVCRGLRHAPSVRDGHVTVYPENVQPSFKELQTHLLLNERGFYVPVENAFGWNVWYFVVPLGPGCRVSSVNCRTGHVHGGILLGHFAICNWEARLVSERDVHGALSTSQDGIRRSEESPSPPLQLLPKPEPGPGQPEPDQKTSQAPPPPPPSPPSSQTVLCSELCSPSLPHPSDPSPPSQVSLCHLPCSPPLDPPRSSQVSLCPAICPLPLEPPRPSQLSLCPAICPLPIEPPPPSQVSLCPAICPLPLEPRRPSQVSLCLVSPPPPSQTTVYPVPAPRPAPAPVSVRSDRSADVRPSMNCFICKRIRGQSPNYCRLL